MKLTPDQVALLRRLLDGPIESAPTEDLMVLLLRRLVSRGGLTWTITKKGEEALTLSASQDQRLRGIGSQDDGMSETSLRPTPSPWSEP